MKKTLFIILALCSTSYGLSGYSLYKTYVAKDTVTHINLDSNFYRGVNWSNKLADTIDRNFIRWYDFNSHDSTLRYFKVDTILANRLYANRAYITPSATDYSAGLSIAQASNGISILGLGANNLGTEEANAWYIVRRASDAHYNLGFLYSGQNFVFELDSVGNGAFNGTLTSTTLNTGNGANELYAMDQAMLTTSDVVFDSTRTRVSVFDSLKLGSGSYLKNYVEGSFPCTLKTSDVTVQQVGTINYTIIGNVVHLTFPYIYGTSNSTTLRLYCGGLTGALDPGSTISAFSTVVDNAVSYSGSVVYTYGLGNYFLFSKYDGSNFTGSGPKGIGNWLYTSRVTIQYTK